MAAGYAWFLVLGSVFLCNLMKTLLPSISSFVSIDYKLCLLFFKGEGCTFISEFSAIIAGQTSTARRVASYLHTLAGS